ncbi:maleylacetoacetate isomerase [Roseococcus sp. DSY-14]|uniref:maleylacetoacetate isomerase n=1 Tax=Roseococcus sp. DSY-14 TaxID=3369650 RepID=UPI00387B8760
MRLYTYFRSSTAYRLRIALNWKGVAWEGVPVSLPKGEHRDAAFLAVNPQGGLPALVEEGQPALVQSMALLDWLEETHPEPPLLPADARERAMVRALAQLVASEIHPLTNLRVLKHLRGAHGWSEADAAGWVRHWTAEGLRAFEATLHAQGRHGEFCWGGMVTQADICLVPAIFNARRWEVDLSPYPLLTAIADRAAALPAFAAAHPARQPDAA